MTKCHDSDMDGGEGEKVNKPPLLLDIIRHSIFPIGKNPNKLRRLRQEKKLSMRELQKRTGHSYSYLQKQLRKHGIDQEKGNLGIAPYGWDWIDKKLVENPQEQDVLRIIIKHFRNGWRYKKISSYLNKKGIPSKQGHLWWPNSVRKIVKREIKNKK